LKPGDGAYIAPPFPHRIPNDFMTIPTGLILRAEFRPQQYDEGTESPRGGKAKAAPAGKGGEEQGTQNPDVPKQSGTDQCMSMLPMVLLMVGVFYFFLIRPQKKQENQLKTMRAALKKGDRIVTSGGMHAIVTTVTDNVITMRPSADGPLMTFDASAIGRVIVDEAKAADGKEDVKKIDNGTADGGQKG
jgi:preprotein translocase subunit YajC